MISGDHAPPIVIMGNRPVNQMLEHIIMYIYIIHTYIHLLTGTTQVSCWQKSEISLDLLEEETVSGSGIS